MAGQKPDVNCAGSEIKKWHASDKKLLSAKTQKGEGR